MRRKPLRRHITQGDNQIVPVRTHQAATSINLLGAHPAQLSEHGGLNQRGILAYVGNCGFVGDVGRPGLRGDARIGLVDERIQLRHQGPPRSDHLRPLTGQLSVPHVQCGQ